MTTTIQMGVRLETMTCCVCGTPFAIESGLNQWLLDHRRTESFYCPKGHSQHYLGMTDAERERDRRLQAEASLAMAQDRLQMERRSHAATKGQMTRLRNRIAAGVCPWCKRSFTNVRRHIEGQHPEHVEQMKEAVR